MFPIWEQSNAMPVTMQLFFGDLAFNFMRWKIHKDQGIMHYLNRLRSAVGERKK